MKRREIPAEDKPTKANGDPGPFDVEYWLAEAKTNEPARAYVAYLGAVRRWRQGLPALERARLRFEEANGNVEKVRR